MSRGTRKKKLTAPERRRALPERPVQARSPVATWKGPGPCPTPPELLSGAAQRGELLARQARVAYIEDVTEIVEGDLDAREREPERNLRRFMLNRFKFIEAIDPSPPEARRRRVAAVPLTSWDPQAARAALRARRARRQETT